MAPVEPILDKLHHSTTSPRHKGHDLERMTHQRLKPDARYRKRVSGSFIGMVWSQDAGPKDAHIDQLAIKCRASTDKEHV